MKKSELDLYNRGWNATEAQSQTKAALQAIEEKMANLAAVAKQTENKDVGKLALAQLAALIEMYKLF